MQNEREGTASLGGMWQPCGEGSAQGHWVLSLTTMCHKLNGRMGLRYGLVCPWTQLFEIGVHCTHITDTFKKVP